MRLPFSVVSEVSKPVSDLARLGCHYSDTAIRDGQAAGPSGYFFSDRNRGNRCDAEKLFHNGADVVERTLQAGSDGKKRD